MASIARSGLDRDGNTVWWCESVFRPEPPPDPNDLEESETDEQRYSQLRAKIGWAIEDYVYQTEHLYRPHEEGAKVQLTEKLRQIWQERRAEFESQITENIRAGNVDGVAYHIFNLYRLQVLVPVLLEFKRNPSLIKLSGNDGDQWKTHVVKCSWKAFKRIYFESIADAMGPLLSEIFSGKISASYVPKLHISHKGQGLPKLRPRLEAVAFN